MRAIGWGEVVTNEVRGGKPWSRVARFVNILRDLDSNFCRKTGSLGNGKQSCGFCSKSRLSIVKENKIFFTDHGIFILGELFARTIDCMGPEVNDKEKEKGPFWY